MDSPFRTDHIVHSKPYMLTVTPLWPSTRYSSIYTADKWGYARHPHVRLDGRKAEARRSGQTESEELCHFDVIASATVKLVERSGKPDKPFSPRPISSVWKGRECNMIGIRLMAPLGSWVLLSSHTLFGRKPVKQYVEEIDMEDYLTEEALYDLHSMLWDRPSIVRVGQRHIEP